MWESLDSITEESLVSSVVDAFSKETSCPPPPAAFFGEGELEIFFYLGLFTEDS